MRSGVPIALIVTLAAGRAAALEPSPRKQCTVCHAGWTQGFVGSDRLVDVTFGPETVGGASDEDICYSCHDGYVQDSRAEAFSGRGHPVGVRPPESMRVPDGLPRTKTGELYCGTCHTVHESPTSERVDFSLFLRVRNDRSELCQQCHDEAAPRGGGAHGHPFDPPRDKRLPRALARAGARLAEGDGALVCETCHRTHGTNHPAALRLAPDDPALCAGCHPDKSGKGRLLAHEHGVRTERGGIPAELVAKGARLGARGGLTCLTCHKAHRPPSANNLLVQDNRRSQLCLDCHADKQRIKGSEHDLSRSEPAGGRCGSCHDAHGWSAPLGEGRPEVAVCGGCHGEGGMAKTRLQAAYSHSVERMEGGAAEAAELPLFDSRVHEVATGGKVACGSCHDVHGAAGEPTTDLLRRPEAQLCAACHRDHQTVAGTAHDLRASDIANAKGETAQQAGLCGACHFVHGGPPPVGFARALAANYDPATGACLSCHGAEASARGASPIGVPGDHPVGPSVRPQGDIGLPLVEGTEGQFVSCTTCHEVHGRQTANRLLRAASAPEALLCTKCHDQADSVVGTPHDLIRDHAKQPNTRGRTVDQSGVCSACHVAHGGEGRLLWAARPSEAEPGNPAEGACLGCHGPDGPGKQPPRLRHPDWPAMTTSALWPDGTDAPSLADSAGQAAPQGQVHCRTCHRLHRDGASPPSPNRFTLDSGQTAELCGSCHGNEALRLFLRFHDPVVVPTRLGVGW